MAARVFINIRPAMFLFIIIAFFAIVTTTSKEGIHAPGAKIDVGYETKYQIAFRAIPLQHQQTEKLADDAPVSATSSTPHDLLTALSDMQSHYFTLWLGKWTTAIDWTAAVMNTHLTATLSSLSHSLASSFHESDVEAQKIGNEINRYFAQSSAFFFGEDYFAIRTQAFDDMLWVVLEWLDSIHFIDSHARRRHNLLSTASSSKTKTDWYAEQFIPAFAHRARVFYELAEEGWDWTLCGGGMTWNPRLLPYKNAITNQLFISASVGMYLHFPGDENSSPFIGAHEAQDREPSLDTASSPPSTYNPIYLAAAQNGYDWLANSGMTNEQGLYTDGFHISGYAQNHSKTECDERNEMVYTYNQGVILSGLRGLWEATGNITYLEDGHDLVRNVIRATGFNETPTSPTEARVLGRSKRPLHPHPQSAKSWAGLGSNGILTELCDPSGSCSQDGQTFKGIFFHHLTAFCTLLPTSAAHPGKTHAASELVAKLHKSSCVGYTAWVVRNAEAALGTKDGEGRFGMWWGAGEDQKMYAAPLPKGAQDYRNDPSALKDSDSEIPAFKARADLSSRADGDLNERGRGRTVETQGGGVAVVRAMWEFQRRFGDDEEVDVG